MSYEVIRHSAVSEAFKFMKVVPDAVYFNTPDGNNQFIVNLGEKYQKARGNEVLTELRNKVVNKGRKIPPNELIKAAQAYIAQFSSVKHSDNDPDILTEDDVEIIETPYPENGKAQIPKRSFIYDDEDGYPVGYLQHANKPGSVFKFSRIFRDGNAWVCEVVSPRNNKQYLWIYPSAFNKSQTTDSMFAMYKGLANNAGIKIPDDELWKCVNSFLRVAPQRVHQDNRPFVRHSLFTEVYDMDDYLQHHGILGMKWGVRRYQNADGSLTDLGRKRYNVKATRAQLENATSDRERRAILTKSSNKSAGDVALSFGGLYAGMFATAGLVATLGTPVAVIPAAVATTNFVRSVIYNTYKGLKLSDMAAEFDVATNVTRSREQEEFWKDFAEAIDKGTNGNNTSTRTSSTSSVSDRVRTARETGRYDMEFLEKGLDTNPRTGETLEGRELDDAYKKYLEDKKK